MLGQALFAVEFWADSRFAPSHWETSLLCNDVSHWPGASLESALTEYVCCWFLQVRISYGSGTFFLYKRPWTIAFFRCSLMVCTCSDRRVYSFVSFYSYIFWTMVFRQWTNSHDASEWVMSQARTNYDYDAFQNSCNIKWLDKIVESP